MLPSLTAVFFGLMHLLRRRHSVRAGFMHVPLLAAPGRPGRTAALALDTPWRDVQVAQATAMQQHEDRLELGGAVA